MTLSAALQAVPSQWRRLSPAWRLLLVFLVAAALLRIRLMFVQGYTYDVVLFRRWAAVAYEHGLLSLPSQDQFDYIGYSYVLWLIGALAAAFATSPLGDTRLLLQLVKLPGIIGDLSVIVLLFWLTRRWLSRNPSLLWEAASLLMRVPLPGGSRLEPADRAALLAAALYAFNVGVLYDSGYWGQTDSLVTFFMLASLAAQLEGRPLLSWVLIGAGFLMKPQAIVLMPLLAVMTWRQGGLKGLAQGGAAVCAVFLGGLAYFLVHGEVSQVLHVYDYIFLEDEGRVSVSAWNLWHVFQFFRNPAPPDALFTAGGYQFSYDAASKVFTALALGVFLVYALRSREPGAAFVGAAFLVFTFFMLPMKIHERYLFPIFALLAPVAVVQRRWLFFYVLLTFTFTLNLMALMAIVRSYEYWLRQEFSLAVAGTNIILFLTYAALLIRSTVGGRLPSLARRPARVEIEM